MVIAPLDRMEETFLSGILPLRPRIAMRSWIHFPIQITGLVDGVETDSCRNQTRMKRENNGLFPQYHCDLQTYTPIWPERRQWQQMSAGTPPLPPAAQEAEFFLSLAEKIEFKALYR
jgi:hypothetical protein